MRYEDFICEKLSFIGGKGIEPRDISVGLFDFQEALTRWALKRGRAAIFADTGLGKTRMQLAWAEQIPGDVLILAPLAVAEQTVAEGVSMGIHVTHCRTSEDVRPGINITNYERLHRFNVGRFAGVVLDESSIIKHHDSKTLSLLLEAFRTTDYKLCATATPSPNDWTELGTHAEFLGICTRAEMLSEFFVHDGGETQVWRLKGHARQQFWRWVSSWGAMVKSPSDLGFDGSRFKLPPIHVHQHIVECDVEASDGKLFALEAQTLSERRDARRASMKERVAECAAIVNANDRPWVVWCDLNAESEALTREIRGAVEVKGADSVEHKENTLKGFAKGEFRVIVTKPRIAGFGLNWQHCADMAFVGVADSFESYYQAVRRCWRFGQKKQVGVHVFTSSLEGAVLANLRRKEEDAKVMGEQLAAETAAAVRENVLGMRRESNEYSPKQETKLPAFMRRA